MTDLRKKIQDAPRKTILEIVDRLEQQVADFSRLKEEYTYYRSKFMESETKFSLIVQNIPDVIYVLDSQGVIKFISNVATRYGYSPEELNRHQYHGACAS